MRASGRGYEHYLGKFLRGVTPFGDGEVERLAIAHALGDKAGEERLVFGHMRLAFQIAASYQHHNKIELFSAAIDGLYDGLGNWPKAVDTRLRINFVQCLVGHPDGGLKWNIKSYLMSYVRTAVSDFIYASNIVPMPGRTARLKNEDGTRKFLSRKTDTFQEENTPGVVDEHQEETEMRDLMDVLKLSSREKRVVELRLEGLIDLEIAERMGFSRTEIQRIRLSIGAKLKKLLKGDNYIA